MQGGQMWNDSIVGLGVSAWTELQDSPPWDAQFVARLKKANLALLPTLTSFDFEAGKGGGSSQDREAWIANWIATTVAELGAYSQAGATSPASACGNSNCTTTGTDRDWQGVARLITVVIP
jgi:hypothetical protein